MNDHENDSGCVLTTPATAMNNNSGSMVLSSQDYLQFDSEHRLRAENLSWDIDVCYPLVADITFRTTFIPLKRAEAEAIRAYHDVSWRHTRPSLSPQEKTSLVDVERSINEHLEKNFQGQPAFIRLCGRSPKDGDPLDRDKVWNTYTRNLAKQASNPEEPSLLDKMLAIAHTPLLCINSGAEAMALILSSERVYADILDWLRFGEPEQICLREWSDELSLDYEFRVFVHNGQITGISQYDHYSFFPHLVAQKQLLQEGLLKYWEDSISPRVRVKSYVVDIGYYPESQSFVLIELSPFFHCTGSALFSWERDTDVLHGRKPMEFRIKEAMSELHPQIEDLIQVNWEYRWSPLVRSETQTVYADLLSDRDPTRKSEYDYDCNQQQLAMTNTRPLAHVQQLWGWLSPLWSLFVPAQPSEVLHTEGTERLEPTDDEFETNTSVDICNPHLHSGNRETAGDETVMIFVYGTLKSQFHWNSKYLSSRLGAHFVDSVTTVNRYHLAVGDCGVPYLLQPAISNEDLTQDRAPMQLKGECWCVSRDCLKGLDEYEGLGKDYYSRVTIQVAPNDKSPLISAEVYVLNHVPEELWGKPRIDEYSMDIHKSQYNPIQHIQVKQLNYIRAPSTWGKVQPNQHNDGTNCRNCVSLAHVVAENPHH